MKQNKDMVRNMDTERNMDSQETSQKTKVVENKIGRNDPCPCGSGKKYKKCCLNSANGKKAYIVEMDRTVRKIEKMIQQGYKFAREKNYFEACAKWLPAWEELKEIIDRRKVNDVEILNYIIPCEQPISEWCQDLEISLSNAGLKDKTYLAKCAGFTGEFTLLLPASDKMIIFNMRRSNAESYFELGDIEKGETAFQELIEHYPDWAWGYVAWGDQFWQSQPFKEAPDFERARSIYSEGLKACEKGAEIIRERMNVMAKKEQELKT
jgi:tetratricopeptide (TPR) repeat protein